MAGLTSLATLAGVWRLTRLITHAGGAENLFRGTASFRRSGPRLIEDEEGWLSLGDDRAPLLATRRCIWTQEPGRLECAFGDMRPFHTVPLGVAQPETTFLCPPDRYEVAYDFSRLPLWRAVWQVEGPKKSYRMESEYRLDGASMQPG